MKEQVRQQTGLTGLAALASYLEEAVQGIQFVHGKGKRKSPEQKDLGKTAMGCWNGGRNMRCSCPPWARGATAYAKTDTDATFMRMKEDHMRNGQLKPGYNVQIAVNSEYITGIEAFSDRSDVRTLRPFMRRMERFHGVRYEEVAADAGYESLDNYLYLESNGQTCFIKPANYDQKKSRKFAKQIGRVENMTYDPQEDCFTCTQGKKLSLRRSALSKRTGSWSPPPGTAAKAARAAPAAVSAAGPKPHSSPKSCACKRPFGKNGSRRTCALPPHGGSICAYAAPSRWRAHLLCSKVTLASAVFSPAAGPTFVPSCSCWRSRLI